jgi:hypothetical protein
VLELSASIGALIIYAAFQDTNNVCQDLPGYGNFTQVDDSSSSSSSSSSSNDSSSTLVPPDENEIQIWRNLYKGCENIPLNVLLIGLGCLFTAFIMLAFFVFFISIYKQLNRDTQRRLAQRTIR